MKIDTRLLTSLLRRTQRTQCVAGKPQPQVTACMLEVEGDRVSTTSIVRDGKTSLSVFKAPAETTHKDTAESLPVPDIDRVLGVLSSHSSPLHLTFDAGANRLIFKSGKKTTRLIASLNGLAFPHSSETLTAWGSKSKELSGNFLFDAGNFVGYRMRSGETRQPLYLLKVDANEMFEALRCDNMNGQKLNRYTFATMTGVVRVGVGEEMKGLTYTDFDNYEESRDVQFEWSFEGGLENVLAGVSGDITFYFLDFRNEAQGMRMVIDLGERGFVYQAGVLV